MSKRAALGAGRSRGQNADQEATDGGDNERTIEDTIPSRPQNEFLMLAHEQQTEDGRTEGSQEPKAHGTPPKLNIQCVPACPRVAQSPSPRGISTGSLAVA
jgi:hypothetical protein